MLKFHIPDFTSNYKVTRELLRFYRLFRKTFIDDMEIDYVYDSFPLIWNGGRPKIGDFDPEKAAQVIEELNGRGIKMSFTFSNTLLTKEHLSDPDANRLMQMAGSTGVHNSVIVSSPILEDYIREKYPQFGVILSTTRQLDNADAINKALEKDYELVVLDYNMNHNWEELSRIKQKDKCEFLVNAACGDNCPFRAEHYRMISKAQIMNQDPQQRSKIKYFQCKHRMDNCFGAQRHKNFMSIDEIREKYEPMGFQHFKIEGRQDAILQMMEYDLRYLIKKEYRDLARYHLLYWTFDIN